MQKGEPISYMLLSEGTPVLSADEQPVGEVRRVLAEPDKDVFDGVIFETPAGERFVDADHVGELFEGAMMLTLTSEEARHLPEPEPNPAVMEVEPDDTVEHSAGEELRDAVRKVWDRVSGNY